ncbi:hypothetical protein PHYPSEUDO_006009 [Phytophthora pseudosyringae]|uniref:SCP domain-containing protein n=1 Tax=Phytophthora pseudosyringae TaxID=221518 RepID=A0A8T1VMS6_9STRA|nr:hypothetical protein PHYPSEUDO_006009 [Phytophthora pseudosyringae]
MTTVPRAPPLRCHSPIRRARSTYAMPSAVQSSLAVIVVVVAAASSSIRPDMNGSLRLRHAPRKPSQTNDAYSALLVRVNQERAAHGLSALCASSKLQKAAQRQAEDMAANDYMHHVGSDGSTVPSRISDAGYKWKSIAENVAGGQADAKAVVGTWMNSTGHRMNILGDYSHFGAGYTYNPDGMYTHYWAQEFATSDTEDCDETRLE